MLVFADYGGGGVLGSLPGAALDAARVRWALQDAGWDARMTIARDSAEYRAELERLGRDSREAEEALLYTTGHGMEVSGAVWLIPPGFDPADRRIPLAGRAIALAGLHAHLGAQARNVLVYAGCRDNPLGLK